MKESIAASSLLARARTYISQKDYISALQILEDLRKVAPEEPQGYLLAADALKKTGHQDEVEPIIKEGFRALPDSFELMLAYVDAAMARLDYKEALRRAIIAMAHFPDRKEGVLRAANSLTEMQEYGVAESLLLDIQKKSSWPELWTTYAEIAMKQRDFSAALKRWAVVRERFPQHPAGYARAAWAYMETGDYVGAEMIAIEGQNKVPNFQDAFNAHAEIAMRQRNFSLALERWKIAREKFPRLPAGYSRASTAFQELADYESAEKLALEGQKHAPYWQESWNVYAEAAMRQRDFPLALKRWEEARVKFPNLPAGYTRAASACLEIADYETAESLALEGQKMAPQWLDPWSIHAEIAMRRRYFTEALRRWEIARSKFPHFPSPYARAAFALLEMGDFDGAEKLALEGQQKAPQWQDCWTIYAEIALRRRDFNGALKRWENVREKFPYLPAGYARVAFTYLEMADFDAAEDISLKGMKYAPQFPEVWQMYAETSMRRRDFAEALRRWKVIREKFPSFAPAYARAAFAYLEMGEFSKAEEICLLGIAKTENYADCHIMHAEIAMRVQDYDKAVSRWEEAIKKFPHNGFLYGRLADAMNFLKGHDSAIDACNRGIINAPGYFDPYWKLVHYMLLKGDRKKALDLLAEMQGKFSAYGWIWQKLASLSDNYQEKKEICLKGIRVAPSSFEPIFALASLEKSENPASSIVHFLHLYVKFPGSSYIAWLVIDNLMEAGLTNLAYRLCKKSLAIFPEDPELLKCLVQCLFNLSFPYFPKELHNIVKKLIADGKYLATPNRKKYSLLLNILGAALSDKPDYKLTRMALFQNFINTYHILSDNMDDRTYINHKNTEKIGFVCSKNILSFYAPIIREFDTCEIDIIAHENIKNNDAILLENGVSAFNIFYGYENIKQYDTIVIDASILSDIYSPDLQKVITLFHSHDNIASSQTLEKSSCFILPAKQHAECSAIKVFPDEKDVLTHIPVANKCELAFTGPYQAAHLLDKPREYFRERIATNYGIKFDGSRPLIFILEDEISHLGQTIWCANALAEFADVVFKTWSSVGSPKLKKLSPRITLIDSTLTANNDFRYASDFIMAGFISGTLASSIMLGLPVIPFYSRYCRGKLGKVKNPLLYYTRFIPKLNKNRHSPIEPPTPTAILINMLNEKDMLHDLLDIDKLRDSILSSLYKDKFFNNLEYFRKNAFGDFILDNPAKKTCEYIRKFVKNHTLAENCSAIYLKDKFFCN